MRTAYDMKLCNPNAISAAWVDADGTVHRLPQGETHSQWAEKWLQQHDFDYESFGGGWSELLNKGWVRISNFAAIEVGTHPTTAAMQQTVDLVVGCATSRPDIEPDDTIWFTRNGFTMWVSVGDFVAKHGGRESEERLYAALMARKAAERIPGGRAKGMQPGDFDASELAAGIKVEQEHTGDKNLAREIAMDHLAEIPDYYTRLKKMEDAATTKAASTPKKYDHIDFKPPQGVAEAAAKGLELRQKASPSNRGGLTPAQASKEGIGSGVQRAVNLKNRDTVSPDVIKQMVGFFARHEKNKDVPADKKGEPWNAKGHVAWLLWGGDPGRTWAEKVRGQMETADSESKTASMFSRDVATPEQVQKEFDHNLALFRRDFNESMRTMDRYGDTPEIWAAGRAAVPATAAFMVFINGRTLVSFTAQLKQVPSQHRRMFDMARREFARTRKFDYPTWFGKNIEMLRMVYNVGSWPDVSSVTPEAEGDTAGAVTLIGSIRIVNQTDQNPEKSVDIVRRAVRALSDSGVPSITRVLYGDMFIVGEVARKKSLAAWYYRDRDIIEVLSVKRFAEQSVRVTIHELGHRYWLKFMDRDAQQAWQKHHSAMSYANPDPVFPEVGDVLDYVQGKPTVSSISQGIINFEGGGFVLKGNLVGFLRDRARQLTFPTPYAATNAEEHFCESLSLFCLGDLKGANLAAFKVIVLGETAEQAELSLVASWSPFDYMESL